MIEETQNIGTDISLNALKSMQNNVSSKAGTIYSNQSNLQDMIQMDAGVTSISKSLTEDYQNERIYSNDSRDYKSIECRFPWLKKFAKILCTAVGNKNYQVLERFLFIYIQYMTKSIRECSDSVSDIVSLRDYMSNTLIVFHFYWKDIKQYYSDHNRYLNKMTQLLGIYFNLELKINKDSGNTSEISAKLLSMLWIYLDQSKEHVLNVLLKIKPISKKNAAICEPIFMKCFSTLMTYSQTDTDVVYVRNLLFFKIWKSMKKRLKEKKNINKMALTKLGAHIPKMHPNLLKCIPQPSVNSKNQTIWLLQCNTLNVEEASEKLFLFEEEKSRIASPQGFTITDTLTDCSNIQTNVTCSKACTVQQILSEPTPQKIINDNLSTKGNSTNKKIRNRNSIRKVHKLSNSVTGINSKEVVFIDLTKEENNKLHMKIEDKKNKRKLEWLKHVREKCKMQKSVSNIIEIIDAHSAKETQCKSNEMISRLSFDNKVHNKVRYFSTTGETQDISPCSFCSSNVCNIINRNVDDTSDVIKTKKEVIKCKICEFCNDYSQQDGTSHSQIAQLLRILKLVDQTISNSQLLSKLGKNDRDENCVSHQGPAVQKSKATQSFSNSQCKKQLFAEEKVSLCSTSLLKMCQNCQIHVQSVKQESLVKEEPQTTYAMENLCKASFSELQTTESLLQNTLQAANYQADTTQGRLIQNANGCTHCYPENSILALGCQKQMTCCSTENDRYICDKNSRSNTCTVFNECVNVLNRISQLILSICTEKQQTDLLKPKADMYSVLVTILGDKVMKSLLAESLRDINSTFLHKLRKALLHVSEVEYSDICRDEKILPSNTADDGSVVKDDCEQQTIVSTTNPHTEDSVVNGAELKNIISTERLICDDSKLEYEMDCMCRDNARNNQNFVTHTQESQETNECKIPVTSTQGNLTNEILTPDGLKDIDILDSILNGDMSMEHEQDILGNSQSSLISSGSSDNCAGFTNCITKFITQSDESNLCDETDTKVSIKSLPEGSLGTTGILNSLLDFDLINMDITSNDFMYSNIQRVNPRIIRKNAGKDLLDASKPDEISTYECGKGELSFITDSAEDFLVRKKDETCTSQGDVVGSNVDIVGFGLNPSEPDIFDLPTLEDEGGMADDKNVSSSCDSPLLISTDMVPPEFKGASPKYTSISPIHDLSPDIVTEQSYTYIKDGTSRSFQPLNDTSNRLPNKTCMFKDGPLTLSTDSITDDALPSLPHTFISPVNTKEFTSTTESHLGLCNVPSLFTVDNKNNTNSAMLNCKQKSPLNSSEYRDSPENSYGQCNKNPLGKRMARGWHLSTVSTDNLQCDKRTTDLRISCPFQSDEDKSGSKNLMVGPSSLHPQDTRNINNVPESTAQSSYNHKQKKGMCSKKNVNVQLKSINMKHLNVTGQTNKRVLINMHRGNTSLQVSKHNMDQQDEKSICSLQEDLLQDSNIVYELASKCSGQQPKGKSRLRGTRNHFVREVDVSATEQSVNDGDCATDKSDNIFMKLKTRWFIRSVNTQTPLIFKKQIRRSTNILFSNEESSVKKRKVASKYSPLSKTGSFFNSLNQLTSYEKISLSSEKYTIIINCVIIYVTTFGNLFSTFCNNYGGPFDKERYININISTEDQHSKIQFHERLQVDLDRTEWLPARVDYSLTSL